MVSEIYAAVTVRIESDQLRRRIEKIRGRYRLFDDLIYSGKKINEACLAVCIGLNLINAVSISSPYLKDRSRNRFAGVSVILVNGKVRSLCVLDNKSAYLAREELNMVFAGVDDMV